MSLKTPSFWYPKAASKQSWKVAALRPFAAVYGFLYHLHQMSKQAEKADIPVICIGNLVAGGTGKTPTAIAVFDFLKTEGFAQNPVFLLRGYGGAERGPVLVDLDKHTAWDVGDESLILAQHGPTIVSADRIAGARLAQEHGADLVLMDDGLQNPGIHKDFSVVIVNGEMGFGNGLMMPAGPLREPLKRGLSKADMFFMVGKDKTNAASHFPENVSVMSIHLETDEAAIPDKDKRYFAFAGLGYPEKFFTYLKDELGLNIVETQAFADHCPYAPEDIKTLHQRAKALDAELITTRKDHLRIPLVEDILVHALPVKMVLESPDLLKNALQTKLD